MKQHDHFPTKEDLINGALTTAPLFGTASPVLQLQTIAAHLIDLQLEPTQAKP